MNFLTIFTMTTNAPTLTIGSIFPSQKDLLGVTQKYCQMTGNDFVIKKQDKSKIRLRCPDKSCPFFVYATSKADYEWEIRTLGTNHTCDFAQRKRGRGMDETSHVAKLFVKPKNGSGSTQLREMLRQEGQVVSYQQCCSFIGKHNNMGNEKFIQEIRKLPAFYRELQKDDPNGCYRIWQETPVSYRVNGDMLPGAELRAFYVGWGWTKHFQNKARLLLLTDACHTKGSVLLLSCGERTNFSLQS